MYTPSYFHTFNPNGDQLPTWSDAVVCESRSKVKGQRRLCQSACPSVKASDLCPLTRKWPIPAPPSAPPSGTWGHQETTVINNRRWNTSTATTKHSHQWHEMKYINSNHKTANDRRWNTVTATTKHSHQWQKMKYINSNYWTSQWQKMKYINSNHKTANDRKWNTLTATTKYSRQWQKMKYINSNHKTQSSMTENEIH